jgi:hypothetical protein
MQALAQKEKDVLRHGFCQDQSGRLPGELPESFFASLAWLCKGQVINLFVIYFLGGINE